MATFAKSLQEIIYKGKNVQKKIPDPTKQAMKAGEDTEKELNFSLEREQIMEVSLKKLSQIMKACGNLKVKG